MYTMLVVVKHPASEKHFLFEAPAFSTLRAGDRVQVSTRYGDADGRVVECATVDKDSESYRMICAAANATFPLRRVNGRIDFIQYEYPEDKEAEQDGNRDQDGAE